MDKSMGESIKAFGLKKVLDYLDADPERNISRVVDWLIKVAKDNDHEVPRARSAKQMLADPSNNWYQLVTLH